MQTPPETTVNSRKLPAAMCWNTVFRARNPRAYLRSSLLISLALSATQTRPRVQTRSYACVQEHRIMNASALFVPIILREGVGVHRALLRNDDQVSFSKCGSVFEINRFARVHHPKAIFKAEEKKRKKKKTNDIKRAA
ncbi:hypothetical protein PUN28_019289 [Cardiocondyla obscurior]|uniref:Uncharacterized protein n=1 Tax=Cardiocondyla obscurior TaxID=286306 RepID=A0AAW2EEW9_9HYME